MPIQDVCECRGGGHLLHYIIYGLEQNWAIRIQVIVLAMDSMDEHVTYYVVLDVVPNLRE